MSQNIIGLGLIAILVGSVVIFSVVSMSKKNKSNNLKQTNEKKLGCPTIKAESFNTGYISNSPQPNANNCQQPTSGMHYPVQPPYVDYGSQSSSDCYNILFNSPP